MGIYAGFARNVRLFVLNILMHIVWLNSFVWGCVRTWLIKIWWPCFNLSTQSDQTHGSQSASLLKASQFFPPKISQESLEPHLRPISAENNVFIFYSEEKTVPEKFMRSFEFSRLCCNLSKKKLKWKLERWNDKLSSEREGLALLD